jgi:hypothetical protein
MFDIVITVAGVVLMAKVADMENRSTIFWGAVTLLLCLVAMFVFRIPYLGVAGAVIASFLLMFAAKLLQRD